MAAKTGPLHITDIDLPEKEIRKLETHDQRVTRERNDALRARAWSERAGVVPSKVSGR